jgi:hypothetical protein
LISIRFFIMRYSFGLLALASLAISTPLQKRQEIDYDAYNDVPIASAVGAPMGVTAVQATTAAYNPSAAAASASAAVDADTPSPTDALKKRDTPAGTIAPGCTALAAVGNVAVTTTPDTPAAFAANPVFSNAALNAKTPNGYTLVTANKNGSAEATTYLTYTTKGMTSYDPSICAGYCTALAGCSSFNICM